MNRLKLYAPTIPFQPFAEQNHPLTDKVAKLTIVQPKWEGRPHINIVYDKSEGTKFVPATLLEVGKISNIRYVPTGDFLAVRVRDECNRVVRFFGYWEISAEEGEVWTEVVCCEEVGPAAFFPNYLEWKPFDFERTEL